MKVKNINARRQNSCGCGTWLDHWVKVCGWPMPEHCAVSTCMAKPQLGAHVQKDSPTDTTWYIIPLCVKHSIRAASLEIADTTALVSAHVNETCAKQMPIGNVWPHDLQTVLALNSLGHGLDAETVHDRLGLVRPSAPRLYGKRKPGRCEPLALRLTY